MFGVLAKATSCTEVILEYSGCQKGFRGKNGNRDSHLCSLCLYYSNGVALSIRSAGGCPPLQGMDTKMTAHLCPHPGTLHLHPAVCPGSWTALPACGFAAFQLGSSSGKHLPSQKDEQRQVLGYFSRSPLCPGLHFLSVAVSPPLGDLFPCLLAPQLEQHCLLCWPFSAACSLLCWPLGVPCTCSLAECRVSVSREFLTLHTGVGTVKLKLYKTILIIAGENYDCSVTFPDVC